jgi:hypothetical protein
MINTKPYSFYTHSNNLATNEAMPLHPAVKKEYEDDISENNYIIENVRLGFLLSFILTSRKKPVNIKVLDTL